MQMTTIGLDLAKHVFQVHGVEVNGTVIEKRRLRRNQVLAFFAKLPSCLIGMEACATAHFWARELRRLGHEVRLIPPQYVKPYVRRGKNDAADAAAICEAVSRPSMRYVPIKTEEQQSVLVMHRARDLLVRQRTQLANAIRGHLAEFGLIQAQGIWNVGRLLDAMRDDATIPEDASATIELLAEQLGALDERINRVDARIAACHKANVVSQRLATIPGIGPLSATAITATVADAAAFRSGREVRGLARPDTGAEVDRRQTAPRKDQSQRRSVHPAPADHRSADRVVALEGGEGQSVGPEPSGSLRPLESRGGTRQQNGPHRLGLDGQRRVLPADRERLTPQARQLNACTGE
jgi:transposase